MSEPTHHYADVNGIRLHYVSQGSGPLVLFLHGFPEFWYAWRRLLPVLAVDHQAVAVDMRGYNLSSRPDEVDAYALPILADDVRALADHLGAERLVLVAHDWGAAVAWMLAMQHPDRLERLVIINGSHPAVFMRELKHNPAQRRASRYMLAFRIPGMDRLLSAFGHAALRRLVGGLFRGGHLTSEDRREYLKAWSQPGAIKGGLNYYRAARLRRRGSASPGSDGASRATPKVKVPTLVIWGERDRYLLTGNLDGLEAYAEPLTVRRIPEGTHWVVHERPAEVGAMIREFIGERRTVVEPPS